jgi:hypothetical protein
MWHGGGPPTSCRGARGSTIERTLSCGNEPWTWRATPRTETGARGRRSERTQAGRSLLRINPSTALPRLDGGLARARCSSAPNGLPASQQTRCRPARERVTAFEAGASGHIADADPKSLALKDAVASSTRFGRVGSESGSRAMSSNSRLHPGAGTACWARRCIRRRCSKTSLIGTPS